MPTPVVTALLMTVLLATAHADKNDVTEEKPDTRTARQQFFWEPNISFLSRQVTGALDVLGELMMLGILGIPILGIIYGGMSMANYLGLGAADSGSSGRNRQRRDLAGRAVLYARNLFDVLANLEDAFRKYDIVEPNCQLRAICEAHRKDANLGTFGESIINLMRMQRELEEKEIIPIAKFIFMNYAEAARKGGAAVDCGDVYNRCEHPTEHFLKTKTADKPPPKEETTSEEAPKDSDNDLK